MVLSVDDCDDSDPTTVDDMDCDGVLSVDDCDDSDASTVDDMDCDGVLSADDCDDSDPLERNLCVDVGGGQSFEAMYIPSGTFTMGVRVNRVLIVILRKPCSSGDIEYGLLHDEE